MTLGSRNRGCAGRIEEGGGLGQKKNHILAPGKKEDIHVERGCVAFVCVCVWGGDLRAGNLGAGFFSELRMMVAVRF